MDDGQQDLIREPSGALIPQDRHGELQRRSGVRACAEASTGAVAATGCFGRTFYATRMSNWQRVLELCEAADAEFVARVAIYSRTQAYMKDMPALLCAWLSARDRGCTRPCSRG